MVNHHSNFLPGTILIAIRANNQYPNVCHESILNGINHHGVNVIFSSCENESGIGDIISVQLADPKKLAVLEAMEALSAHPDLVHVEPNFIFDSHVIPNDQYYPYLWGMEKINAPVAWNFTAGNRDIVVGVVDSGIDYSHPDIAENMWVSPSGSYGRNFYDNDHNTMDYTGHGTHVAGTIGAIGNNYIGVTGVCWRVRVASLKIGNQMFNLEAAISSIAFAIEHDIPILNNSWGSRYPSEILRHTISQYGGLFVAAAGNSGDNSDEIPVYPAAFDNENIISVASTEPDNTLSPFSNYGAKTVDIAAPGNDILSLSLYGEYTPQRGTSMSAPHVAGAAALLKSFMPHLTTAEIKHAILSTASAVPALQGKILTGGILNAGAMFEWLSP
jgi:subtilisin family serine protease